MLPFLLPHLTHLPASYVRTFCVVPLQTQSTKTPTSNTPDLFNRPFPAHLTLTSVVQSFIFLFFYFLPIETVIIFPAWPSCLPEGSEMAHHYFPIFVEGEGRDHVGGVPGWPEENPHVHLNPF